MDFYINLIIYFLAFIGILITDIALMEEYFIYSKSRFLLLKRNKMRYYKKGN